MKITATTEDRITILELEGNLTIGAAAEAFSADIERQLDGGRPVIVLDMEHVRQVDSTGLGSLVRCHHRCIQAGGGAASRQSGFPSVGALSGGPSHGSHPDF